MSDYGTFSELIPIMVYLALFLGVTAGLLMLVYMCGLAAVALVGNILTKQIFVIGWYLLTVTVAVIVTLYIVIKVAFCH